MGLTDSVAAWVRGRTAAKASVEYPQPVPAVGTRVGGNPTVSAAIAWAMALTPSQVWKSQPYVRTVVTFLARNTAQVGLHTHRRVSETERERLRDHPVAKLLARPNPNTTSYELVFQLVGDLALYDRGYWIIGTGRDGAVQAIRLPPARIVEHVAPDPLGPIETFRYIDARGRRVDVPGKNVLYFPGWNPVDPLGLPESPLESLKNVIAEQAAAFEFRKLTWDNGAQVQQVITRPADAPRWSKEARDGFMSDVRSQFGKDGPRRGGVALFEDGMTMGGTQFNAREAEWIEAAKLSLAIVASSYHVNPTMVGLLDNANYSNVREFRRGLYGDTLGPTMAQIEDRINAFLVPQFPDSEGVYVEFNIAEKLQGSFEEQAAALQTAVGAPWMLRSEARARLNLPPIPDTEQIVTPLNVLVGGLATPNDTAPPPAPSPVSAPEASSGIARTAKGAPRSYAEQRALVDQVEIPPYLKAKADDPTTTAHQAKAREVVGKFFDHQARVVKIALGAKADADWWDAGRWDRELGDDLYKLAVAASSAVAAKTLDSIGFEPDVYDVDQTLKFLKAVTARAAGQVNEATKAQLDEALASDDPAAAISNVFDIAGSSRTEQVATTATTVAVAFGATEAARQAAGDRATKTWVTGPNPRPSHAAMNGETVGIDEPFSSGQQWPGDATGDTADTAGCNCSVVVGVS